MMLRLPEQIYRKNGLAAKAIRERITPG